MTYEKIKPQTIAIMREAVRRGAVVSAPDEKIDGILKDLIDSAADIVDYDAAGVVAFFPYYMADQGTEALREDDGENYWMKYNDKIICAVGVSVEALEAGPEHAALVFLHELTHCLFRNIPDHEHDKFFHAVLDDLIETYNAKTGLYVENDYYGLND